MGAWSPASLTQAQVLTLEAAPAEGAGSEVMQRIAAPLLSMLVIPAAYYLMRRRGS